MCVAKLRSSVFLFIFLVSFLFITNAKSVFGQVIDKLDISGKVIDNATQKGIQGVSVSVKKSKLGTTTNANGEFILKNVEKSASISFTPLRL